MLRWYRVAALAPLAMVLAAGGADAGVEPAAVALTPHQALYDLSLKKVRANVSINNATGRILYSFGGSACEGYSSDFHQASELQGADDNVVNEQHSVSWESGDGTHFRFHIETRSNDDDPAVVDGSAERHDGSVTVRLKQPAAKTLTLSGDTIFPTEQIRRIIAAGRDGRSVLELKVYDGSDGGEKVYNTFTVIGRPIAAAAGDAADAALKAVRRWPVTISYYDGNADPQAGEQTPAYTMAFELYENGVSRALSLDSNDFVLGGTLSQYDAKTAKPCKP